jgi:hypothetical protein
VAHAVKGNPLDEFGVHAALQQEIFQQATDLVVGEGRGHRGLQAESPAQAARDVVFAAALPDFEFARATDASFARVEPEHDFPQREHVIFAL